MTKSISLGFIVVTAIVVIASAGFALHGLFNGAFDKGLYEIKMVQQFSTTQVAVVAKTSDGKALDGDVYFVLIGDHRFSPQELRRDYYRHRAVFATSRDCLKLEWKNSNTLQISCAGEPINKDQIDVQKSQSDHVTISYLNIATAN